MVIDSYIHIHPMPSPTNGVTMPPGYEERNRERMVRLGIDPDNQAASLIPRMDAAGVDAAVIQNPFPHPNRGHVRTNDSVAEAIKDYPGRFYAFAGFNIHPKPDVDELVRAVTQLGMKGVRLLPSTQEFRADDWELMAPVYETLIELDVPVFIQAGPTIMRPNIWHCDLRPWHEVAKKYPQLKYCIAHMGHGALGGLEMAMLVANTSPNGYIDAAGAMWFCAADHIQPRKDTSTSDIFLYEMVFPETPDKQMSREHAAVWDTIVEEHARLIRHLANTCNGKLIYGTDIPFIARFDFVDLYRDAIKDKALVDEILGGTMQRLLRI